MAKITIGTGLWVTIRGYLNSMFTELFELQTTKQDLLTYTPENLANKNIASGYAGLDVTGKISPTQLPALVIFTTYTVASQIEMLALAATVGNLAVRTDTSKTYILSALPATVLGNWTELLSPAAAVASIFGRIGAVTAQSGDYTADQVTETATRVFVTPAQKVVLGNTSNTNSGDNAVNSLYSGIVPNANHTGDATGSSVLTLAPVNANVGSFTNATVTVNAKGLVTAAASGSQSLAIFTDGTSTFRFQVRDGAMKTDYALNSTGFAGTESIDLGVTGDWINLRSDKFQAP